MKNKLSTILEKITNAAAGGFPYACCCKDSKFSNAAPATCRNVLVDEAGNSDNLTRPACGYRIDANGAEVPDTARTCMMVPGFCSNDTCAQPPILRQLIGCDGNPIDPGSFPPLSGKKKCEEIYQYYFRLRQHFIYKCNRQCETWFEPNMFDHENCLRGFDPSKDPFAAEGEVSIENTEMTALPEQVAPTPRRPTQYVDTSDCRRAKHECHCRFQLSRWLHAIDSRKEAELYANGCPPYKSEPATSPTQQNKNEQKIKKKFMDYCAKLKAFFPVDNQCAKNGNKYVYGDHCAKACNC